MAINDLGGVKEKKEMHLFFPREGLFEFPGEGPFKFIFPDSRLCSTEAKTKN